MKTIVFSKAGLNQMQTAPIFFKPAKPLEYPQTK